MDNNDSRRARRPRPVQSANAPRGDARSRGSRRPDRGPGADAARRRARRAWKPRRSASVSQPFTDRSAARYFSRAERTTPWGESAPPSRSYVPVRKLVDEDLRPSLSMVLVPVVLVLLIAYAVWLFLSSG